MVRRVIVGFGSFGWVSCCAVRQCVARQSSVWQLRYVKVGRGRVRQLGSVEVRLGLSVWVWARQLRFVPVSYGWLW